MASRTDNNGGGLIQADPGEAQGPVECLGLTFPDDKARREHFIGILAEKLKAPEFRKIEGFPHGSDEDILALSDPPYYTACPNPFIADFIKCYGKLYDPDTPYSREPFAADVSEGRNDPIYNAHSYHTKVPHKAIMRYILHYTEPGDLVFDGFCGTGMTGVAAQMCGDKAVVESLGYLVERDGSILRQEADENGKTIWKPFSKLGARRAVLNDLSPAATFISYNYNTPVDVAAFEREAKRILKEVDEECGWMYETLHTDGRTKGKINYTVWSDVFICPECSQEVVFWQAAVDKAARKVLDIFACPHCGASLSKRNLERAWVMKDDPHLGFRAGLSRAGDRLADSLIRQAKQIPVLINYSAQIADQKKRFEKKPDKFDLELIKKIENSNILYWYPTDRMIEGSETRRNDPIGITHVHHFYTKRSLYVLSALRTKINGSKYDHPLSFLIGSYDLTHSTLMTRIIFKSGGKKPVLTGYQSGTLYVSSLPVEKNIVEGLRLQKLPVIKESLANITRLNIISSSSTQHIAIANDSIDYFFFDPPFGANINYSELNFLWESWLRVLTNSTPEAIENDIQKKGPLEYRQLMTACFKEAYRALKPGRWMTVEFSNTKASVWNSIQTALSESGFIVANVSALDKQQGTLRAVTTPTAVKQDLIISAYKPNGGFEKRFLENSRTEEGVWEFVRSHLKYLTVVKGNEYPLQVVPERDPRLLYDQVVAYYVRQGHIVPLSSQEFQSGLAQRFSERDGLYFLPEQAAAYDQKRHLVSELGPQRLFVSDEASAVQWLRRTLTAKPQTFQAVHPHFLKELEGWNKHEKMLELSTLLEQNFLCYDGQGEVPSQIHSYLSTNFKELRNLPKEAPKLRVKARNRWYVPDPNKAGDLEKLRERSLLKEFEDYRTASQKRLKVFRLEAVRAGFKKAWQERDYATIISVARKIPENILQEDPKLLMWYDQAITRIGVNVNDC